MHPIRHAGGEIVSPAEPGLEAVIAQHEPGPEVDVEDCDGSGEGAQHVGIPDVEWSMLGVDRGGRGDFGHRGHVRSSAAHAPPLIACAT